MNGSEEPSSALVDQSPKIVAVPQSLHVSLPSAAATSEVRNIVIDSEDEDGSSNPSSPTKLMPHFDHDYGSASGARLNTALEFYGDGQNNETFPSLEGLGGEKEAPPLPRSDQRIIQYHKPNFNDSTILSPKSVPVTKVLPRVQDASAMRRSMYTVARNPRTVPVPPRSQELPSHQLRFVHSMGSRPVSRPYVPTSAQELPISRPTPNVLRTSNTRPRVAPASTRPVVRPKPTVQFSTPENTGLMNVMDEEEAHNQKFFQKHPKIVSNVPQMRPIIQPAHDYTPVVKQVHEGDLLSKPRGRGRPSNAQKQQQQQSQGFPPRYTSPTSLSSVSVQQSSDRKKLESLADVAQQQSLVVQKSPPYSERPIKQAVSIISENEAAEVLTRQLPSAALEARKVERQRKRQPRKQSIQDDDGEEGVDYVTRCLCKMTHNDNFMIQCDHCDSWQHVNCFGGQKYVDVNGKFLCHVCDPRPLPLDATGAKKLQLNYLKDEEEKEAENKRRKLTSKVSLPKSTSVTPSAKKTYKKHNSRRYEVIPENVFSRKLRNALSEQTLPEGDMEAYIKLQTVGESRCQVMKVAKETDGLVTTMDVKSGEPLVEYKGQLSFLDEEKSIDRLSQPSVFNHSIIYTGLGPSFSPILADASRQGSLASETRKSCRPNAKISHFIVENKLKLFLIATEDIESTSEITLPFDCESRGNPLITLECACLTNLVYLAGQQKCLMLEYNKKVADGTLEPPPKQQTDKAVSPEKAVPVKTSPRRSPVKEARETVIEKEVAVAETPKTKQEEDVTSKASTSVEKTSEPKIEKGEAPRRSNRKRNSTNERTPTLGSNPPKRRFDDLTMDVNFSQSTSREDRKLKQQLALIEKQDNGKTTRSNRKKSLDSAERKRKLPDKDTHAKKVKGESPEQTVANVLLGLSQKAAEHRASPWLWKDFVGRVKKNIGPYSNVFFSDIQQLASSMRRKKALVPVACLEPVSLAPTSGQTDSPKAHAPTTPSTVSDSGPNPSPPEPPKPRIISFAEALQRGIDASSSPEKGPATPVGGVAVDLIKKSPAPPRLVLPEIVQFAVAMSEPPLQTNRTDFKKLNALKSQVYGSTTLSSQPAATATPPQQPSAEPKEHNTSTTTCSLLPLQPPRISGAERDEELRRLRSMSVSDRIVIQFRCVASEGQMSSTNQSLSTELRTSDPLCFILNSTTQDILFPHG